MCISKYRYGAYFDVGLLFFESTEEHFIKCKTKEKKRRKVADDTSIAQFNAQSVNSSEKRAEISTLITNIDRNKLFLTETWLRTRGDCVKSSYLTPAGYNIRSFPQPSRRVSWLSFSTTASPLTSHSPPLSLLTTLCLNLPVFVCPQLHRLSTLLCSSPPTQPQEEALLVSWCFKPSQPQRITSGLSRTSRLIRRSLISSIACLNTATLYIALSSLVVILTSITTTTRTLP